MNDPLFSPSWYRVSDLKPRLKSHANLHRHEYRNHLWYVLQDRATDRFFRFTPDSYYLIGLMDGKRSLGEIWQATVRFLGDHAPTQNETIRIMSQLHAADMLQCDITPNASEIFSRHSKQRWLKWTQRIAHPLAIRIPLFDPDRLLVAALPYVRPLISWFGLAVWALVVGWAAVLAAQHWEQLTGSVIDQAFTANNLLLLWLIYPLVKALHEFGHGITARAWGAAVHEMGIMLLVLIPVPYVEASSTTAFPEKGKRMAVAAAGIMVELFLAALALFLWLVLEPGLLRALAYNVMLVGGVSTLLFNGNPLLRFDGYYVFADAIEVPNLQARSKKYLGYLVQRYIYGNEDAKSPVETPGEHQWLLFYGVTSSIYRLFIMFVIITFIAGKFFFVGIALAIWALVNQIVMPVIKGAYFVLFSPELRRKRSRAVITSVLIAAGVAVFAFVVPAPLWTSAEGVVWLPEESLVHAEVEGFVTEFLAAPGTEVSTGDPLIALSSPLFRAEERLLLAKEQELRARYTESEYVDLVQAGVIKKEIESVVADLELVQARKAKLTVRSPSAGVFVVSTGQDLPGRFAKKGQLLGYIIDRASIIIRVVVDQENIGLVRNRTLGVDVQHSDLTARPMAATILRQVPAGTFRLPSIALGAEGGGNLAVDPQDPSGMRILERVFEMDVDVPDQAWENMIGSRVIVRFDHGTEPIAFQLYRTLRQLFLSQFSV